MKSGVKWAALHIARDAATNQGEAVSGTFVVK